MMQGRSQFPPDVIQPITREDEVDIEPQRGRRVTIWVVVADGEVYVRSVRAGRGRWYQRLTEQPLGMLHVGTREVPFQAVHVADPKVLQRVTDAFRQKYERRWPRETAPMVKGDSVNTTLRLEPLP